VKEKELRGNSGYLPAEGNTVKMLTFDLEQKAELQEELS